MITEKRRIEAWTDGKNSFGKITLDKVAIPETITVTLDGEKIIPSCFDVLGHPHFTLEQERLYRFKEYEINRNSKEYIPLFVTVQYEERKFLMPRNYFDSMEGINYSLSSLESIHDMLSNRAIFKKAYPNEYLNEFVLFGCFYLDQFGQVMSIDKKQRNSINYSYNVEYPSTFYKNNYDKNIIRTSNGFVIPKPNSVCPCCGKELTVDDIIHNPCIEENGKTYHYSCYRNYRKVLEVDKLTRGLMDIVYKKTDYTFELLPNGYCNDECCSHIPWILFHTIYGDIIVGFRKRVISIEWQENYKPFKFDSLFKDEDVTKWKEENGKRGIHAWSQDKAIDYLGAALKDINPEYSKF